MLIIQGKGKLEFAPIRGQGSVGAIRGLDLPKIFPGDGSCARSHRCSRGTRELGKWISQIRNVESIEGIHTEGEARTVPETQRERSSSSQIHQKIAGPNEFVSA